MYFGASAGVGKTFAMLADATSRRSAGVDVVVGVIASHGWRETAAAASAFATIAPQVFESRGAKLHEFDLDAALARRPTLLLVDELSHLNVAGARHARRWQDVQELLDAGISVATTLDVQHLESLNDVVERITGVTERERVPDDILERADEVVLIDLPAEETLARLHGGTFLAPRLARAPEGFYTLPNLVALRELALRVTAERVHAQVQAFRDARLDAPTVPSRERLLVCIGPSPLSARLVRSARRMAGSLQAEWIAAFVEPANRAPD
ncbi:MAG: two-component system sensor histidine kinase KdbD, partial [Planctomycetes bacterium]|nr:two-component system sensor histidine kinase KdbD [Planctomycetota bacterium]